MVRTAHTTRPHSRRILTREAMHSHFSPAQRCVVEVYTYLRMGGKLDGIEVVALDAAALPSFGEFKAEDAKCYSAEDLSLIHI